MSLDNMKEMVAGLVLVAIIIAALALAMNSFRDDMGNQCMDVAGESFSFNTSSGQCYNSSGLNVVSGIYTYQYNVTQEGLEGTSNASSYLSTIGTLIGVSALIAIVVGAFYLIQR